MLQELQTVALIGLLVSTYYLTIGCRNISESLPDESGHISNKIDATTDKIGGMTEVLDDIANLLNEGLHTLPSLGSTQTASSPMEAILSGFISRMTSPIDHGPSETQQEEWEILPPNDEKNTQETETKLG